MSTDTVSGVDQLSVGPQDIANRLKRMGLAVPAIAILVGAALIGFEPIFGFFGVAVILGWTQLVGL